MGPVLLWQIWFCTVDFVAGSSRSCELEVAVLRAFSKSVLLLITARVIEFAFSLFWQATLIFTSHFIFHPDVKLHFSEFFSLSPQVRLPLWVRSSRGFSENLLIKQSNPIKLSNTNISVSVVPAMEFKPSSLWMFHYLLYYEVYLNM